MPNRNSHSYFEQLLHDFYLGNMPLAELSFDLEKLIYGEAQPSKENIFVTGLARSGTTSVFNYLHESNEYASLLYSDMPFLLMPNLWGKIAKHKPSIKKERFHGDNILVANDSPEALDEFFWKVFLENSYIEKDTLLLNNITESTLLKYEKYISLICLSRKKEKYISKNNNSILRLSHLAKLNTPTKIILLYRNPIDHASSLLKLHLRFSELQQNNKFTLRYFNYLGHHEFGLNQKSFQLNQESVIPTASPDKTSIDFWLTSWINYYNYILTHFANDVIPVSFEDICLTPEKTYSYIKSKLNVRNYDKVPAAYVAPIYNEKNNFSTRIHEQSLDIYNKLNEKREYI